MTHEAPTTAEAYAVEIITKANQKQLQDRSIRDSDWEDIDRSEQFDRLDKLIGNTPLLPVGFRNDKDISSIYQKRELLNPSGSHYDRAFLATIRSFEESGFLHPGDELRDITSGSGGISLATMAWALGYKARITVPSELPSSRLLPMRYFNAEIVDAGSGYMLQASAFQSAEIHAHKADPNWALLRPADRNQRAFLFERDNKRICYLNHSENTLSPNAFQAIGREIVAKLAKPPLAVLLAMGNWTTIAGISPILRSAWGKQTKIVGYEGENTSSHDNYGTSVTGIPLRFRDESLLDDKLIISNDERDVAHIKFNKGRYLMQQVGHSSLMGLAATNHFSTDETGDIVVIAYDRKILY